MHIADIEGGNLGANGVVGGGLAMAAGAALSVKMRATGQVVLCFFGDGAANRGIFNEALNLASIWSLPVVYLCENNQYAMSTPVAVALSVEDVAKRAAGYNMPGVVVDGNDVLAVYEATRQAVERAREGQGPTLVEGKTYRWKGHSKSDQERYRTKEEVEAWKRQCPIARFRALLIQRGVIDEAQGEEMEREAYRLIEEAVAFAEASPEPKVEAITEGVYAP